MKFEYSYRTSDNVKHEGVISASNRDVAFAELKSKGVHPERVVEAPGLLNKVLGKGKRWIAIAILGLGAIGLLVVVKVMSGKMEAVVADSREIADSLDGAVRRQIIGDAAIIEKGEKTGWSDFLAANGDRFLASFAVPGIQAAVRTCSIEELEAAIKNPLTGKPTRIEFRQVFAIVNAMKAEMRKLHDSGWTYREIGAALAKRQDKEIAIYNRTKNELGVAKKSLDSKAFMKLWDKRNDELRELGIRSVPLAD